MGEISRSIIASIRVALLGFYTSHLEGISPHCLRQTIVFGAADRSRVPVSIDLQIATYKSAYPADRRKTILGRNNKLRKRVEDPRFRC